MGFLNFLFGGIGGGRGGIGGTGSFPMPFGDFPFSSAVPTPTPITSTPYGLSRNLPFMASGQSPLGPMEFPEPKIPVASNTSMRPIQDAIASVESRGSGDYTAVGPTTKSGDRAYGRYQVMGNNIPAWTKEVTGLQLTPDQFLRSSKAQDAVFNSKFGSLMEKHGLRDAASIWLTGRSLQHGGTSAHDMNKMTGRRYADEVLEYLRMRGQ